MKKTSKTFVMVGVVAVLATASLSAQTILSGNNNGSVSETSVETEYLNNNNNSTDSAAGAAIEKKTFGNIAIASDHCYGNMSIGYRFGKDDDVAKQIVIGIEGKEMFRIGDSPVLFGIGALGQARTNNSEFCVEYMDLFGSIGFEVGNFYFGLSPKVNIRTPKGVKIQLDAEWYPVDGCTVYAYGLTLINTDESNKNYVVSGSKWSEGSESYKEYGGGLGVWYQFNSGCFVSLDTGLFYTNNKFLTKDGAKESVSWKTTVKAGGSKLAGCFTYSLGDAGLTNAGKGIQQFTGGVQIAL